MHDAAAVVGAYEINPFLKWPIRGMVLVQSMHSLGQLRLPWQKTKIKSDLCLQDCHPPKRLQSGMKMRSDVLEIYPRWPKVPNNGEKNEEKSLKSHLYFIRNAYKL